MASVPLAPPTTPLWAARLERALTQIDAGRSVPLLLMVDRRRATAERLEATLLIANTPEYGPDDIARRAATGG